MRPNPARIATGLWAVVVCIAALMVLAGPGRAESLPVTVTPVPWEDPALRAKIDPALLKQLVTAESAEPLPVVVEMRAQADLAAATARLPDRAAAAALTVQALRATAEDGQRGLRMFLLSEAADGRVSGVRPLWVINAVAARAAPQTILQLAARPDVALVRADRWRQWVSLERYSPGLAHSNATLSFFPFSVRQQSSVEWGVHKIGADRVWAAFGITGTGVVVANMDTGVDWLHPALRVNYRGCVKDVCQHSTSWYDATEEEAQYPQDGHGHGTHTMGTLAGQGGIGVAPGARWITARVLNAWGYGLDSWIHAGFQWMLAPGGDPTMAPDVVNNSWGNTSGGDTTFQNDVRALRAAGILAVFSNGNEGPYEGTVGSPASLPESFAVGAIDSTDAVAYFSGRGPSPWGQVRPHVSAPGVNVRSAWPGGVLKALDGTSMAAPHVSGVAALMLSANPGAALGAAEYVLTTTAVPLSTTRPNNESGWGRVDAYAAVMALAHAGELSGTVTDASTHAPISGASIVVSGVHRAEVQTDADGRYVAGIAAGVYDVSVGAFGYEPASALNVVIHERLSTARDWALAPMPAGTVQGRVVDAVSGLPVTATVTLVGVPVRQVAYGAYRLTAPAGTYTVRATALGYRVLTATVTITAGATITRGLSLAPGPKILLVDGDAWYSKSQIGYFQQALDELGYSYETWVIRLPPDDTPHDHDLLPYDVVIWSSPLSSPGYVGANNAITSFLSEGHRLLISGQDIAFWDGGGSLVVYAPYLFNYFKARYVRDDAGSRALAGLDGEIMAGLSMTITGPGGADNQQFPDEITLSDPDYASQILAYQGDGSGGQKVGLCLPYRGIFLSFGYEAITDAATRRALMLRAMDYFASPPRPAGLSWTPIGGTEVALPGGAVTFHMRLRNNSETAADRVTLTAEGGKWPLVVSPTEATVESCRVTTVTLTVTVPAGTGWNAMDVVTLTARSSLSPSIMATSVWTTKTPAPVLLVDDDRWYDMTGAYAQALTEAGVAHDIWLGPPSASRLGWYPVVVWFTGYDWYDPINAEDEVNLASFLEGGGRLFLSSPFYLAMEGLTPFARTRLGVSRSVEDLPTDVAYGAAGDPLGEALGVLPLTNPYISAGFYVMGGALVPERDTATALRGGSDRALALHRAGADGRTVFMITPFEALSTRDAPRVMRRAVGWLGWLGDSTLRADRSVAQAGESLAFTLTARHNASTPIRATMTATWPLGVTFIPASLTPGASYSLASRVVTWTGTLDPGAAVTVAYRVTLGAALSTGTRLTTTAVFRDDTHGIPWDQLNVVRVGAPDLTLSTFAAPSPVTPATLPTYTLVISNSGSGPASFAGATVLLPMHISIVTGSLALSGSGSVTLSTDAIRWHGALEAGRSALVTYRLDTTRMLTDQVFLSEALLDDGAGGAAERQVWVEVTPFRFILPLILKY